MPAPPPAIQTTTPLTASAVYTSSVVNISRATAITGSVFSDVAGTLVIKQGGDGVNFDLKETFNVPANTGVPIELDVYEPYVQAVFTNGNTAQTQFRLFVNLQDAYGAFLSPALAPSSGGAYLVLFQLPNSTAYQVVGRFDGADPFSALQNAAVFNNKNGQYAGFRVTDAFVAVETLQETTTYEVGAF